MIISAREKALLAITVVFALYATLAFSLRSKMEEIKSLREQLASREQVFTDNTTLVEHRPIWEERYEANAGLMPVFPRERRVETHWLGMLDRIASQNSISIIKRQVGEEKPSGEVYEMPVECREWEGSLESLVAFLYDIHAEGVMLDIRKLYIRPLSGKSALLRGSFTLYCAYLREGVTKNEESRDTN